MGVMNHQEITVFILALGILLGVARFLGELVRRYGQPAVLGELLAGVLLGPTLVGSLAPELSELLFPATGPAAAAHQGLTVVAITMFLLVVGMEVNLAIVWRQRRTTAMIAFFGLTVPFALGALGGWLLPGALAKPEGASSLVFSLFMGVAMAICALPVIAKIMLDLGILRTDLGMMVMAAAILDDLVGWLAFAVVLGMMGSQVGGGMSIPVTIMMVLAFAFLMLTLGRYLLNRILPFIQAHASWPGGVLGFTLAGTFLAAAFTEWVGIHAVFGAFLFGVALGDSHHLREQTRRTLEQFIAYVLAPLFFASVGLKVNFVDDFNWLTVLLVLVIGTAGKSLGCFIGGKLSGLPNRESLAIGCAMNARGVIAIILALVALETGVIGDELFVALVVMALVTSMTSGSLMQKVMGRKPALRFQNFLTATSFRARLAGHERSAVISELASTLADAEIPAQTIIEAVERREQSIPSGLGQGLAVPHARLPGLKRPRLAVGLSPAGVDFGANDQQPATVIFLILIPADNPRVQLEVLADIGRHCHSKELLERLTRCTTYTEFLALLNSETKGHG